MQESSRKRPTGVGRWIEAKVPQPLTLHEDCFHLSLQTGIQPLRDQATKGNADIADELTRCRSRSYGIKQVTSRTVMATSC